MLPLTDMSVILLWWSHLSSYQRLKAGLKVVNATVVEFRHLVQKLLVLGFKVFSDGLQFFPGLKTQHTYNPVKNTGNDFWLLQNDLTVIKSTQSWFVIKITKEKHKARAF